VIGVKDESRLRFFTVTVNSLTYRGHKPYNEQINKQINDLHLSDADSEVGFVELVRNVPTEWSELAPLLHQRMEKAQTEQHLLPSLLLHTPDALIHSSASNLFTLT